MASASSSDRPHNSSMDSCGGSGSSRPSPIISQVKLFVMGRVLKSKLSGGAGGCGELSPAKFQRSTSVLHGGKASGTLMSAMGGGGAFLLVSTRGLTVMDGEFLAAVLGAAGGSWDLRSVSTCSAIFRAKSAYRQPSVEMRAEKKRGRT